MIRIIAAAIAALVVIAAVIAIADFLAPKTYFVSPGVFRNYLKNGVPQDAIDRLQVHSGREFAGKDAFRAALRSALGEGEFDRYEAVLMQHARSNICWATGHARPVYQIQRSNTHPLYGSLTAEPVLGRNDVPIVPTNLVMLPASGGTLILGQRGHLFRYNADFKLRWKLQIPGVFELSGDQGALGITLDPDFANNRFVYVSFAATKGRQNVVQRMTLSENPDAIVKSLVDVIRFAKEDRHHFHGIAALYFDREGALLVTVGDPTDYSQNPRELQGKVLRLIPGHGPNGGYSLPSYGWTQWLSMLLGLRPPLIQGMGLRAPFQATPWRGGLIIGDVGGNGPYSYEKINLYRTVGQNFGWGACGDPLQLADYDPPIITYRRNDHTAFDDMTAPDPAPTRPGATVEPGQADMQKRLLRPAHDPRQGETEARTVVVGVVYEGGPNDRYGGTLDGRLLYADFYLGFIRGAALGEDGRVTDDVFLTRQHFVSGMIVGHDGYIYLTTAVGEYGLLRLVRR